MSTKNKRFGLGTSFEDLCETNELSIFELNEIIDTLSDDELSLILDELSASIDTFIRQHQSFSYNSLDELLMASIQSTPLEYQQKPTSSNQLFDDLDDLLDN